MGIHGYPLLPSVQRTWFLESRGKPMLFGGSPCKISSLRDKGFGRVLVGFWDWHPQFAFPACQDVLLFWVTPDHPLNTPFCAAHSASCARFSPRTDRTVWPSPVRPRFDLNGDRSAFVIRIMARVAALCILAVALWRHRAKGGATCMGDGNMHGAMAPSGMDLLWLVGLCEVVKIQPRSASS